jgi:IMP dehydrogenase
LRLGFSLGKGLFSVEIEIGRGKKARQAYGFDDIAIVPSRRTRDPQDVDIGWKLGRTCSSCRWYSAMDGVVSPKTASSSASSAGRVLNLEGISRATRPRTGAAEDRPPAKGAGHERDAEDLRSAGQARLVASRIRELKEAGVLSPAR